MIILDIHHQLKGKAYRSRILIESCLKTLERRCSRAQKGPAHCRIRVSKEHSRGHFPTHQPLQIVATVELIIPGWGHPFVATYTGDRLREAVAGAVGAIEKMLRRETEKNVSERRRWNRAHRWDEIRFEEQIA